MHIPHLAPLYHTRSLQRRMVSPTPAKHRCKVSSHQNWDVVVAKRKQKVMSNDYDYVMEEMTSSSNNEHACDGSENEN